MTIFTVILKVVKWETYEVEAEDAEDAEENYAFDSPVSVSDELIEIHSVVEKQP